MINKAILTQKIARASDLSCRDASTCIDIIIDTVTEALSAGKRIELRGLGSFTVRKVAAKKTAIINNAIIPEHGRIVFRPCQKLRESVWNRI